MEFNYGSTSAARDVASRGSRFMHHAAESASEMMGDMSHSAKMAALRSYKHSRDAMQHGVEGVGEFACEQPVRSTLIALGVCCLVCAMFIRR
jgi:hypothetical protein